MFHIAMNENKLSIVISKPVAEVFEFTLNPANTPLWIEFVLKEETNEWPPQLGTVYRNTSDGNNWNEYVLTVLVPDQQFTLTSGTNSYHVQYTFTPIDKDSTNFEYFEWVDVGELEEPFDIVHLEKLKSILEN